MEEDNKELSRAALQLIVLMYSKPERQKALPIPPDEKIPKLTREQHWRPPPIRPPAIPGLPEFLIGECTEPYEKQLTESDVNPSQARLSLSKDYARDSILPLLNSTEDVVRGIRVTVYDADGKEFPMKLKLWAEKVYVLTSGWRPFAEAHRLVSHEDYVAVWVFRRLDTGSLCVAVTSRQLPV